jgi:hypothetical protein
MGVTARDFFYWGDLSSGRAMGDSIPGLIHADVDRHR